MILFQYALLFFALFSVSNAAPVQEEPTNAHLEPLQHPKVPANTDGCLGSVYYAPSSLWHQRSGIVPVVVIGPPRAGMVVVVEIAWNMDYLYEKDPVQRKPASEYFPPGTMLTSGSVTAKSEKFRPLKYAWINVARPRIISVDEMWWNRNKAAAVMEPKHLLEFIPLLKPIIRLSGGKKVVDMTPNEIEQSIKHDPGMRWGA
ncbi:hypothetical protein F5887DRAFT_46138 [Amanita rubescens]|nr:hypothetical protein F5887DRAFT_46138 [Amanita rubescens]